MLMLQDWADTLVQAERLPMAQGQHGIRCNVLHKSRSGTVTKVSDFLSFSPQGLILCAEAVQGVEVLSSEAVRAGIQASPATGKASVADRGDVQISADDDEDFDEDIDDDLDL